MMNNQELYKFLKECDCCDICCLRFLKARGDDYEDVKDTFKKLNVAHNEGIEASPKKQRKNICSACLGLFTTELVDELVERISKNLVLEGIECESFVVAISLPIILHIRQFSLWCALHKKFGSDLCESKPPDVPLKEAVKLVINPKLCDRLGKSYDRNGVMVNIALNHEDDAEQVEKIEKLTKKLFDESQLPKKKEREKKITRALFEKLFTLENVCLETYEEHMAVPPDVPSTSLVIESISYTGPTIFVAGKYRKLSRELSHSPWVLQGKRVMEDSIQEIIVREVGPYFGVPDDKIIFSSSGREDVDVRCLGKGRPFILEIPGSNKTKLPRNVAAEMEKAIDKSMKVSVQSLQIVQREEIAYIKSGEEMKKKFYRALCILKNPATKDLLEKLEMPNGFETEQITPIRVLHRRPLHTRPRKIYSVKPYVDPKNTKILILDIVTQAGTYIKELVHGEFGRTNPSICSIIGQWIDIIALDVTGIDLDWPKEVNNQLLESENAQNK